MLLRILSVEDVVEQQLCCGCGACAAARPDHFRMVDSAAFGRRPMVVAEAHHVVQSPSGAKASGDGREEALAVCPGIELRHVFDTDDPGLIPELRDAWGPIYEVWEGFAADPDIRRMGSSGGAATALALYCIEQAGMHGVLHTAAREDRPYLNRTVLSRSREELLSATGSRYAPASPCEGLGQVAQAPSPCIFIGKPCDVAGAQKLRKLRPELDAKLGLTIAFFCAGTPSTQGTLDLLTRAGVDDPDSVTSLRYRGDGWPGRWTVRWRNSGGEDREASLSYEESWSFLQSYRQWRCRICPDHSGEFADIAVGDPWYLEIESDEPGRSLILARTARGLETLHAAAKAGYIKLEKTDPSLLPRSQLNLLRTRGRLWGQLLALRLIGMPTPQYRGFPAWRVWFSHLTLRQKVESTIGTIRRVRRHSLRRCAHQPVDKATRDPA